VTPMPVTVWLDPSCPWAWQAMVWLRDLRDQGEVALSYRLFSLELNAAEPGVSFAEAAPRYGPAMTALALASRDGAHRFEALYVALGRRLHEERRQMSEGLLAEAAAEAGATLAADDPSLEAEMVAAYRDARARDVFGVPTLRVGDDKVLYGPILAVGPTGPEGLALWQHVRALADDGTFFELKRWPRDLRPGGAPVG
jgi:predicted DsbA family dithiol-disulfide isomerase